MRTSVLLLGATLGALGSLSACGGSEPAPGAAPGAVSVKEVSGVGQALVDAAGKTLYFADQETGGAIKCTDSCLSFWIPVTGTAADAKSVSGLATVKRSDTGAEQLTFQGKPLYTFKLDTKPGEAKGNNLSDAFSGVDFTWHAATTGTAAPTQAPSSSEGGGYDY
ncbi:hypothetical protein [Kribbella sp. HUAS MG21]|uniref:Lipoprotein with Yx(FWY)xxD motif n=1 Tax=Kribbella sp. HUAS MG21 TaxID=3160966 RepID=A0AAU7TDS6_9ACTN